MSGMVQVATLDSILDDYPTIRFLKIDIEGYEARALAGASQTLRKQPVICMEVSPSHGGSFDAHNAVLSTGLYRPFAFSSGKSKASSLVPLVNHQSIGHDNVVYVPMREGTLHLG
jgi:methyltransferase FkbM-like protein